LKASGVEVHGIDASSQMIERLRAKPGGSDIPVTIADFRDFDLGRRFGLAYVVFNTFFGLLTQEDQVMSFRAVARHLDQGGAFLMEAFVPDLARFTRGQLLSAIRSDPDEFELEVTLKRLARTAERLTPRHRPG
jgi:Methyltransferase domain